MSRLARKISRYTCLRQKTFDCGLYFFSKYASKSKDGCKYQEKKIPNKAEPSILVPFSCLEVFCSIKDMFFNVNLKLIKNILSKKFLFFFSISYVEIHMLYSEVYKRG